MMMKPAISRFKTLLFLAAILVLGNACLIETASNTTPMVIVIYATPQPGDNSQPVSNPTEEINAPQPDAPEPTEEIAPTAEPPTPTATTAPVTMTAGQALSCVKGPHWILYEWVAGIAEGETVTLLARNDAFGDTYYYVRKADGKECWAYGGSSTVSGDPYSLPEKEAPPLPKVTYVIENKTGLAVCDVLIREKDAGSWGADRLGAGTILPGASFSVELTAGFYDVLIKDCPAGATLYEEYGRAIGADEGYRYTPVDTQVEFYIQNNHGFDICWFAFKPAGGNWMELHTEADGHIANGEKAWFTLTVGYYDVSIDRCLGGVNVDFAANVYFGPNSTGWTTP
jgi:hypothetical protein